MFWRLLLFILIIYWGIKAVSSLLKSREKPQTEVKGRPKKSSTISSDDDIEEVDFKEIKD